MNRDIKEYLFFDIETVSQYSSHDEFFEKKPALCELWDQKVDDKYNEESLFISEKYIKYAGLHPEFGKIICVSLGYIDKDDNLKVKAYSGDNEEELLKLVATTFQQFHSKNKDMWLCGFNCNKFDIPYLIRRMIINNIPLPKPLKITNLKPWDINILDLMVTWQFGNRDFISMKLMSEIVGVEHYKELVDSSKLSENYWNKTITMEQIEEYCNGDVKNTIAILEKLLKIL